MRYFERPQDKDAMPIAPIELSTLEKDKFEFTRKLMKLKERLHNESKKLSEVYK